jgi:predicted dehydrogenase
VSHISPLVQGEDLALVILEFESGVTGLLDCSWGTYVSGDKKSIIRGNLDPFIVEGNAGTIELDPYQDDTIIIATANGVERHSARPGLTPAEAYQESFINTQRHFAECLRTGKPAQNEIADNMETLAALYAAYESATTRRIISLSEQTGQEKQSQNLQSTRGGARERCINRHRSAP